MLLRCIGAIILALAVTGCRSSILDDPTTIIQYGVLQYSHVKLTIENSYNTPIARLVDADQQPGTYTVSFDMNALQEGVYFYTVECEGIGNGYYLKYTRNMWLAK